MKTSRDFVAAHDRFAKPKEIALLDLCCESETREVDLLVASLTFQRRHVHLGITEAHLNVAFPF